MTHTRYRHVRRGEHVRTAAQTIFRHNFRRGFRGHLQQPRVYVTDDDHGLLNCTWPRGGRPDVPTPYSDEVWTGIEHEVGALLDVGEPDAAIGVVEAARGRYDGRKQSPSNDIECGDHYVRAMSAWALLEAAGGYDYDAAAAAIGCAPAIGAENFKAPFVARDGWGRFAQQIEGHRLTALWLLAYGTLTLRTLRLVTSSAPASAKLNLDGRAVAANFSTDNGSVEISLNPMLTLSAGQSLRVPVDG